MPKKPLEELIAPYLRQVNPYVPGKPVDEVKRELGLPAEMEVIKLASNENVLGTSPLAMAAMHRALEEMWLYPEDSCYYLRHELARYHGVEPEQVYLSNGGVSALRELGEVVLMPGDQAIASRPSFMMYKIVSQLRHDSASPLTPAQFLEISHPSFEHDIEAMGRAINEHTKIVWICSPNNPTGQTLTRPQIDRLLELNDDRAIVVLDEAYADFVEPEIDYPHSVEYLKAGRRVVIMRTLSKSIGLAGLRVGYFLADPVLVAYLHRVRLPFSVNALAQAAAIAGIHDEEFRRRSRELVWTEKRYYYARLRELGWDYRETQANFIWIDVGMDAREFHVRLMRKGVIIRPGWVFGTPTWVRVTFGTRAMNERFFEAAIEVREEWERESAGRANHVASGT